MKSGQTNMVARARELLGRRRFKPYTVSKTAHGRQYSFWIGDPTGENWYSESHSDTQHHYDSGQLEIAFVIEHMLEPGDVIFECGAHHGWTTVQIASHLEAGSITAFEPNHENFQILCRNLAENKCENTTPVQAALSASSGQARLFKKSNGSIVPKATGRSLFSRRMLNCLYGVSSVPSVSLDDYVAEHAVAPTFLKIDVEGFECAVLQGAEKILKTRPKLFIEIHTQQLGLYGGSVGELLSLLPLDSYRVWIQRDGNEPPLEVASLDPATITDRVHVFAMPRQ